MGESELDNVTWEGNSKKMFRAIMDAIPSIFKGTVKQEVKAWIKKNNIKSVSEELVLKMFKEKAPKMIWQKISAKLDEMKTGKK